MNNTMMDKALKVYKMWINAWPKDRKGARAIASDFLKGKKEEYEFDQLIRGL